MEISTIYSPSTDTQSKKQYSTGLLSEILPLLKVNRNFPKVLITAPQHMGGLGFRKPEDEQGIESINHIILTYDSPLPTNQLFKQWLEYT